MKIIRSFVNLWRFWGRTEVFFVLLIWLMFLVAAGTLAQKDIGLYMAQQRYFSSWILWVGGWVPLPGGLLTVGLVGLGLLVKLTSERWVRKKAGTLIVHIGALLLLGGGLLTHLFSLEGNMVIDEGATVNFISDPYAVELALSDTVTGEDVAVFPEAVLKPGATLADPALSFTLTLEQYCRNCGLSRRDEPRDGDAHGVALNFDLVTLPSEKEAEMNRAGTLFRVNGAAEEDGLYGVYEFMPIQQTLQVDGKDLLVAMRGKRTYLPFSVTLVDFTKEVYPGTDMAKSYSSDVVVAENGVSWPAHIRMNHPLRYRGYTLFQASFSQLPGTETSVLAVVHNVGRLFPYIASLVMALGLLVHLIQRLPQLFKRENG